MNKLSWIFISVTFLIIAIFGYFFIYPQTTSILKIYSDLNANKSELANITKEKDALNNLSKNNQLQSIFDIASKYIPEDQKSGELIIELSAIVEQSKLAVAQISLESASTTPTTTPATDTAKTTTTTPTTPVSTVNAVDFSASVSGTFTDFIKALQNVESSSRLITITSMSLSQAGDVFSAQITGKAYYKKGVSLTNDLKNIEISQATIDMFQNLKTFGVPINLPTESGFGRDNPFAPTP